MTTAKIDLASTGLPTEVRTQKGIIKPILAFANPADVTKYPGIRACYKLVGVNLGYEIDGPIETKRIPPENPHIFEGTIETTDGKQWDLISVR